MNNRPSVDLVPSNMLTPGVSRAQINAMRVLADRQIIHDTILEVVKLGHEPVFQLVGGFTLIELLQKCKIMPDLAGSVLETALVTNDLLKSLGGAAGLTNIIGGIAGLIK